MDAAAMQDGPLSLPEALQFLVRNLQRGPPPAPRLQMLRIAEAISNAADGQAGQALAAGALALSMDSWLDDDANDDHATDPEVRSSTEGTGTPILPPQHTRTQRNILDAIDSVLGQDAAGLLTGLCSGQDDSDDDDDDSQASDGSESGGSENENHLPNTVAVTGPFATTATAVLPLLARAASSVHVAGGSHVKNSM
jgi:hypothetical protein